MKKLHISEELKALINESIDKTPEYCVATINSTPAQTISSNYSVNLNKIVRANGNFTLFNGGIKVGEGIHHIRVSGGIFADNWPAGNKYLWGVVRNGTVPIGSCIASGGSGYLSSCIPSVIIEVQEGDVINLLADSPGGGTLRSGGSNTWLCVEKID